MTKRLILMILVANLALFAKGDEMTNKSIVLAGGCFWGTQAYMKQLPGVVKTYVAYANSKVANPSYEQVSYGDTNAVEAVYVEYDEYIIDLEHLLKYFFYTIDPTSLNRQGNDVGVQYRSGIYFTDASDEAEILAFIKERQKDYAKPIVVEVKPLENISKAEEYHQDYLSKNPNGYCHVTFETLPPKNAILSNKKRSRIDLKRLMEYQNKDEKQLKNELSPLAYDVVKNSATERAFSSELNDEKREGIYVDITNNQPLFSSHDKFNSGSGWPSFTKPIDSSLLGEVADNSYGMSRVEVRSSLSNSHLGHVFNDGPKDRGGLRYCINGSALKFIPKEDMQKEGYGYLLPYLNEQAGR